ncbi:uncharacterized protein LOC120282728 [Dioscorea cayenensis subsp. rotundata]|uniref:Uncharacterized protein LOC120282728 n=1 Tax=Dioscorea cayennensis subsp. rotundata TaxID=55577 RepID=A0AB40CZR2_DIOCR|nr:uncharacterized protein LOC120282728 [Dioscorea cayenensis subsp. rotundata]
MDMFYGVAKYKGDGYVLDFTVLTGWLTLFEEICTYWALEPPIVRVKYIMADEQKTIWSISSEDDFQNMCNVHRIFKKTVVNMIIDTVNETTEAICKYGGILLGATAKDGNEGLFHLAFAIVDNETDDNWTWFISTLGDAIYGEDDYHKIITFISDRSKGLVNAIAKVFPSAPHGYCLRHLQANFLKANGHLGKGSKDECWRLVVKIAYACTSSEYDATVGALSAASTQAHNWLFQKSDMMHWCNYLFRGQRWGEMYSNVAESFNAGIKEARHLHVCNMVDEIRFKMMNLMYKRRENSMKWETHLCPEIHKKIEKTIEESRCLVIGRSDGDIFEVVDKQGNHVDLRYYTVAVYKEAYESPIFPVPDNDKPMDAGRHLCIRPPISKKRPGRPRKRRIESQAFGVRDLHCSRCHEVGHNRATCNEVIAD